MSLELSRYFADRVTRMVTEMMQRGGRPPRLGHRKGHQKTDNYGRRDHYQPYVPPRAHDLRYDTHMHDNRRHDNRRQEVNHLRLESLTKLPSKVPATELQLQIPPCPPTVAPPKKENLDRYCDYDGEKGHYTNDCYHLKRQLEAVLVSRKLNHLVKDVRQRGNNRGRQPGNNNGKGRVINMILEGDEDRKRKS
ncbi:hypothetical protein Tco_0843603 [Tanacetum coccineum]|uniref:Reverse transcriptase domain-containing protein n=1 Tax=Tanacetum coccineum TaxID=301880 RepID=A0ABQ5B2K9_9ASTR